MFKDKTGKSLSFSEALPKILNRFYNYWLDFELMLLKYVGYVPSHLFRKFCYRLVGVRIGRGSVIHTGANFYQPENIQIGDDTIVGSKVFLDGRDSLIIGNHVDIASEVMIFNSEHNLKDPDFTAQNFLVEIGDYVFVGPRVIILPGVKVGKGAVLAAGAVITKDVADFKIVGGVPAKEIGERPIRELNYKLGRARLFQ